MAFNEKKTGDSSKSEDVNVATFNFQCTFAVENFSLLNEESRIITSPTFRGDPTYGDQWRVQFGHHSHDLAKFTLQLVKTESKEEVSTTFQIGILDQNGIAWAGPVSNQPFAQNPKAEEEHETISISTVLEPKNGYLMDDSVHFYIQVSTHRNKLEAEPENKLHSAEQLKSFLINENFADVILTSENSKFPASKILLAAQSPVFFAMFNSEMVESKSNIVKIEDFSEATVKGFLELVYTGETESLEENAGELLKITDKYQALSQRQV